MRSPHSFRSGGLTDRILRNAGFFVYIDLSPWLPALSSLPENADQDRGQEYAPAQTLLDGGIGLHPCEEHNEKKGWFRLVFTLERDALVEGLIRSVESIFLTKPRGSIAEVHFCQSFQNIEVNRKSKSRLKLLVFDP